MQQILTGIRMKYSKIYQGKRLRCLSYNSIVMNQANFDILHYAPIYTQGK